MRHPYFTPPRRNLIAVLSLVLLLALPAIVTEAETPWWLSQVGAPEAWLLAEGQSPVPVTVAIVDTGVDPTHPELVGTLWPGLSLVSGTTATTDTATADDAPGGHGTLVAGIVHSTAGPLPVRILPVKALAADGSGDPADLAAAIRRAVDWRGPAGERVRIINLSLGLRLSDIPGDLSEAVQYAHKAGLLLVAAAGNEGRTVDGYYPAAFTGVVAVGSVDREGTPAGDSNEGASVLAPGVAIESTLPGGGRATRSGTSFAAPFVSAAGAVLWSLHPEKSRAEVVSALLGGAFRFDEALRRLTALKAPVLDAPPSPSNQLQVVATGRSAPGATVVVTMRKLATYSAREPVGTVTAGPDGRFGLAVSLPPAEGVYTLNAQATVAGETSQLSGGVTVVVDLTAPPGPWGLTAAPAGWGRAVIAWGPAPGADVAGYLVEREGRLPEFTRETVFTDRGLRAGGQYTYRVMAVDLAGNRSEPLKAVLVMPAWNIYIVGSADRFTTA